MSITKGAMLISNANAVGTELVNQLGGTGYKPVEWADKINLLGINSVDAPYAIKSIQAGTYTGEERGAIQYSNCNAVGSMLNKKLNTNRGFKPVEWPSSINVLKPLTENTVTGDICNVSDGAEQVPLKSWSVNIPANLTGKSTVVCNQGGKNLLLLTNGTYSIGNTGATATILNGEISVTGTTINGGGRTIRLSDYFILQAGTYYLSPVISTSPYVTSYLNKKSDNTVVGYTSGSAFTVSEDTEVYFGINVESGKTYNTTFSPQLEVGSTSSAYTPYVAPTVNTVDLGRTVYGADVDVVNGTCEPINILNPQIFSGATAYTVNADGSVTVNGSDGRSWTNCPEFPIKAGTYTFSRGNTGSFCDIRFAYENYATSHPLGTARTDYQITVTQDTYFKIKANYSGTGATITYPETDHFQLEKGSTLTAYSPYFTPFTFNPITPTPETNTSVKNFWNDTGSNTITYYQAPQALTRSTVSGFIASFSDADTRLTCVNAIATIPPSIAGVDTVQLVDAGKNFVDGTNFTRGLPSTTIGASIETITASTRYAYFGINIGGGNFTVSSVSSDTDYFNTILIYGYTNGILSVYTNASVNTSKTVDFSSCDYIRIAIGTRSSSYQVPTDLTDYGTIQLEVGSTSSTYTPYQTPTTYTANLPSTNHGGSVDFVNGVGHSTHIKKTVRWGDLGNVTQLADVTRKEIVLSASEEPKYITSSASTDLLNDKNLPYDMTYSGNFEHIYIANSTRIWIYLPNGTDADTEITICYTLADALQTDFTFTGQAIIPKTGTNNCYNNVGGNTEITYFTNT